MTIRKPVDYLKIARGLTARRRAGPCAPAPSVPSRRRSRAPSDENPPPTLRL